MDREDRNPHSLAVICFYALTSVLMTYPLVLRMTTHVIGHGSDDQNFLWNLWWVKHAIMDLHVNPLYTDYLFHPIGTSLTMHSLSILYGLLLQYLLSLAGIYNLFVLLSFVLAGYGTYMLVLRLTGDWRAALAGGIIFAFSPFHLHRATVHFNYCMLQWIPFFLLYMIGSLDRAEPKPLRHAVLAGVFLGLNFLSEHYYFVFMLMALAMYVLLLPEISGISPAIWPGVSVLLPFPLRPLSCRSCIS